MTESMQSVGPDEFRSALRCFSSGVTVVTLRDGDSLHGVTVSAFSSLSLNPPLVLVCIDKSAVAHDVFERTGRFVVNILREDQEDVSNLFASRLNDKFEKSKWRDGLLGVPVLGDTLGFVECELHESLPGGDHTIFVGRVVASGAENGKPLLYGQGGYRRQTD